MENGNRLTCKLRTCSASIVLRAWWAAVLRPGRCVAMVGYPGTWGGAHAVDPWWVTVYPSGSRNDPFRSKSL